ncbi:MAG: hypothetical protein U0414_16850 [Polyangiaceae bacterium]
MSLREAQRTRRRSAPPTTGRARAVLGGAALILGSACSSDPRTHPTASEGAAAPTQAASTVELAPSEVRGGPLFVDDDGAAFPAWAVSLRRWSASYWSNASSSFREPRTEEAAWSHFAGDVCKGVDVYVNMVNAGSWSDAGRTVGRVIHDADKLRPAFACGKALGASVTGYVYSFVAAGQDRSSSMLHAFAMDTAPTIPRANKVPDDVGFSEAWCVPDHEGPCSDASKFFAELRRGRQWVTGTVASGRQLAGFLGATGPRTAHPRAAELQDLSRSVESFFAAQVGVAESFPVELPRALGAHFEAMLGIHEEAFSVALLDALARSSAIYALGDNLNPRGGALRVILKPADASDVGTLLEAARTWRTAARAKIADFDPPPRGSTEDERAYLRLLHVWAVRSLEEGTITSDATTVRMEFQRRIEPQEATIVERVAELNALRAERGAALVHALLDGTSPPASLFEGIGGPAFEEAVAKAR